MASRSLIGAGAVVTAALIASGVTYAVAGDHGERGTVELVDVSTTPSPSVTAEPSSEPAPEPETTTTTATVEPEPVVTSVAPPPKQEEPVSEPVTEPKAPPAPRPVETVYQDETTTIVSQPGASEPGAPPMPGTAGGDGGGIEPPPVASQP